MAKFEINGKTFTNQSEFIKRGYRCATDVPNQLERERTRNEISLMRSADGTSAKGHNQCSIHTYNKWE